MLNHKNIYVMYRTPENTKTYPLHSHRHWEILYYTRGQGECALREWGSVSFHEGAILCIPPGLMHGSRSENVFENYCIQDPDFPQALFAELTDKSGCILFEDAEREMEPLFRLMHKVLTEHRAKSTVLTAHLLSCVYDLMQDKQTDAHLHPVVRQIKSEIGRSFTDPDYSVSQSLTRLPYSPNYVRGLFREETGTTFSDYLSSLRLRYANGLLGEPEGRSIAEIARMSGFRDPLYFSKLYHKYYGASPTQQRNR